MSEQMKLVANNKKAYHDYFIEEKYEGGSCAPRHGGEVPAHGKVQHQGGFRADRERGGVCLRHERKPL